MNVAGLAFYEVKSISVNEWHPLPDGQGKPEQVHLWIELESFPHPLVMRFRFGWAKRHANECGHQVIVRVIREWTVKPD